MELIKNTTTGFLEKKYRTKIQIKAILFFEQKTKPAKINSSSQC